MKTKVVGSAIGIIGIVLIYVIINVFVVGGQKLYHHDDQVKLDALKAELKDQKATIDDDESELTKLRVILRTEKLSFLPKSVVCYFYYLILDRKVIEVA